MKIGVGVLVLFAIVFAGWISIVRAQVTFVTPSNDEARAPRPQRDRGPALAPAIVAAQAAVQDCEAQGYAVTAVVVDSAGMPVVLLSGGMARRSLPSPSRWARPSLA